MIPSLLQDLLINELKNLFKDFKLKNVNGELSCINIYPQSLPAKKHEDDEEHFPYIVVRLQDGEDTDELSPNTCRILIISGLYGDLNNYQGYKDTLSILNKMYAHLFTNRVINNKYSVEYPVRWSLPEEDTYPFYFGGLETNWTVGKVTQKEDEFV